MPSTGSAKKRQQQKRRRALSAKANANLLEAGRLNDLARRAATSAGAALAAAPTSSCFQAIPYTSLLSCDQGDGRSSIGTET